MPQDAIPHTLPVFLFFAAAAVGLFAFLSVAVWVTSQTRERQARDRFALLKSLAEHPGENAASILQMLREQEERRVKMRERQELRSFLMGGLTTVAAGIGISVMLVSLDAKPGVWTVGLIPFLIGVVLTGFGLFAKRGSRGTNR